MNTCECYTSAALTTDEKAVKKAEGLLAFVKYALESWDCLYRCKVCGQYWEIAYPGAGDVCCVDSSLQKMSNAQASEKYGAEHPAKS